MCGTSIYSELNVLKKNRELDFPKNVSLSRKKRDDSCFCSRQVLVYEETVVAGFSDSLKRILFNASVKLAIQ